MSHHLARARRRDNVEWVEGDFVHETDHTGFILERNNKPVISRFVEINPDTLQRCTGLKDKNGNWIFEGQYFKGARELFQIIWDIKTASYYVGICLKEYKFSRYFEIEQFNFSDIEFFDEVKFNDDGSWERV